MRVLLFWLASVVAFGATASAQSASMTVNPGPVLTAGGSATIIYENSDLAGGSVLVLINDDAGGWSSVLIDLDANGYGTGTWSVPLSGWDKAYFDAPGVQKITRWIEPPGLG